MEGGWEGGREGEREGGGREGWDRVGQGVARRAHTSAPSHEAVPPHDMGGDGDKRGYDYGECPVGRGGRWRAVPPACRGGAGWAWGRCRPRFRPAGAAPWPTA